LQTEFVSSIIQTVSCQRFSSGRSERILASSEPRFILKVVIKMEVMVVEQVATTVTAARYFGIMF